MWNEANNTMLCEDVTEDIRQVEDWMSIQIINSEKLPKNPDEHYFFKFMKVALGDDND
jgi:hypothetical protein